MFVHYHAKTINAERVGARLVRVACTRCGCEYFYKFTRIGSGSAQAPYGLGVGRATTKANQKAQKDLQRRMSSESELVPCPKCNWINEELVAGFRRGSYRKLGESAAALGVFGVILTVILGFVVASVGPRGITWMLLIPVGVLSLSGGMFLWRHWARGRIQPNQDHPLPPKLPVGSPPALLKESRQRAAGAGPARSAAARGQPRLVRLSDRPPNLAHALLRLRTTGDAGVRSRAESGDDITADHSPLSRVQRRRRATVSTSVLERSHRQRLGDGRHRATAESRLDRLQRDQRRSRVRVDRDQHCGRGANERACQGRGRR